MGVNKLLGVVTVMLWAGCTKTVNECSSDTDCKDVAYPFCDVDGQFGPSGGAVGSQLMWTPEAGFTQNYSPRAG